MKEKWVKLGVVGVDSGQLMVCDPCYIDSDWVGRKYNDKKSKDFSYNTICHQTLSKEQNCQLHYKKGHPGVAVAFGRFGGDGTFPVLAKIENGLITEVKISFKE